MSTQDPDQQHEQAGASAELFSGAVVESGRPLRDCIDQALEQYFAHLDGQPASHVYDMVLAEVEAPLLKAVMRHTRNNQSKASAVLGLNRGTLRKKLKQYQINQP
jgi:Fis family transcriptional regulator